MALPNIFSQPVVDDTIQRINTLRSDTPAQWGQNECFSNACTLLCNLRNGL